MQDTLYGLPEQVASKIQPADDGCWTWIAGKCHYGYGAIRYKSTGWRAHRLVYELLVGPIPQDYELHHTCEVRECVNPEHLQPLTKREHRALQRGKPLPRPREYRAACPHGHPYDEANTSWRKDGSYFCRACHRKRERERQRRLRAAA